MQKHQKKAAAMPEHRFSASEKSADHTAGVLWLCALFLVCGIGFSLLAGSSRDLISRLAAQDPAAWQIFLHVRLPRTLGSLTAGSALALSGALLQSVLGNPMASPSLLGVNAGAGICTLIAGILFPASFTAQTPAAFLGAFGSALFIVLVSMKIRASRMSVILAGLALSQVFSAGIDLIVTVFPDALLGYSSFKIGSLSGVSLEKTAASAVFWAAGIVLAFLCSNELEILSMGQVQASSLGMNTKRWMIVLLLIAAMLAGSAIALCGMLGFLGLIVPNLLRPFFSGNSRGLLAGCAMGGAGLLMFCDALGRIILRPYEIPAGILLSLIGGPFFLWLLFSNRSRKHGGSRT